MSNGHPDIVEVMARVIERYLFRHEGQTPAQMAQIVAQAALSAALPLIRAERDREIVLWLLAGAEDTTQSASVRWTYRELADAIASGAVGEG